MALNAHEMGQQGSRREKSERQKSAHRHTVKADGIDLPSSFYDGRISRAIQPIVLVSLTSTGCSRPRHSQMKSSQEAEEITLPRGIAALQHNLYIYINENISHGEWIQLHVEMFSWISFLDSRPTHFMHRSGAPFYPQIGHLYTGPP